MQKNKFLLLALCLLFALNMNANPQDWSGYRTGELYAGYIIKNDGTRVEGYIEAQPRGANPGNLQLNSNQSRVIFYTDREDKKSKIIYKPADLTEYKIADKTYRSMHYSGGLSSKPLRFLLLVKDGRIAQYMWYENDNGEWEETVIFQKGQEAPVSIKSFALGFSKKMSELVSDNKELAEKVKNKEKGYGLLSLYDIIEKYNNSYTSENEN